MIRTILILLCGFSLIAAKPVNKEIEVTDDEFSSSIIGCTTPTKDSGFFRSTRVKICSVVERDGKTKGWFVKVRFFYVGEWKFFSSASGKGGVEFKITNDRVLGDCSRVGCQHYETLIIPVDRLSLLSAESPGYQIKIYADRARPEIITALLEDAEMLWGWEKAQTVKLGGAPKNLSESPNLTPPKD